MATLTKAINKSLFDSILPTYGTPRVNIPTWDDSQKMFICSQYESANGHRYYLGIRFCDRIVQSERIADCGRAVVRVAGPVDFAALDHHEETFIIV